MSFFEIEPMGGGMHEYGGMNIGGIAIGGALTEEQKARMKEGRRQKQARMIGLAREFPQASPYELAEYYKRRYHANAAAGRRERLTVEQKRANFEARMQPGYQPVRRQRVREIKPLQAKKNDLRARLLGHPQSANREATPGFRKAVPIDMDTLLAVEEALNSRGFGFWDTIKGVASDAWDVAKKVAPVVAPFIL